MNCHRLGKNKIIIIYLLFFLNSMAFCDQKTDNIRDEDLDNHPLSYYLTNNMGITA